jgi:hypothetical protein
MEDNLKILKVGYIRNDWLYFTKMLRLSLGHHSKLTNASNEDDRNRRWP